MVENIDERFLGGSMRIKSIKIQNYKSLKNIEINDLGDLVAFIGPNMAGKSNLFDALAFLKDSAKHNLLQAIEHRGTFGDIVWRKDTDKIIKFEITFLLDETLRNDLLKPHSSEKKEPNQLKFCASPFLKELTYTLSLKLDKVRPVYEERLVTNNVFTTEATVTIILKSLNVEKGRYNTLINNLQDQLRAVLSSHDFANNLKNMSESSKDSIRLLFANDDKYYLSALENKIISAFYGYVKQWQWFSPYFNTEDYAAISGSTELLSDVKNLPVVTHTLSSNYPDKFDEAVKQLRSIITGVDRLLTPVSGSKTTIGLRERGRLPSAVYYLSSFSAGIKNVLGILTALMTSGQHGLLMFEEPESHLHPEAIRNLISVFRQHTRNKQILLTTHSATAILNFNIDNVYLVGRDGNNDTEINAVSSDQAPAVVEKLGVRPSDFLCHDIVIFVEGIYDEWIFKEFFEKAKLNIDACYIPTDGWTNMNYHANAGILQRRRVPPKIMAVFDGDISKCDKTKEQYERMINEMQVPKANIFNLRLGEIECYLLDSAAWFKSWPEIHTKIKEDELKRRFDDIMQSDKQKENMAKLMEELGIGFYTKEKAILIVEKMETIPNEIKQILERIQVLKDN